MPASRRIAGAFLLLLAATGAARAGSFQINPVRVTLSASQPIGSLTLTNTGAEPAVVQLEVVRWSQRDGRDVYEPASEVLATPPVFNVPAGGSQIVRVGLRRMPDGERESTYRLFLQEVPAPMTVATQGLQVALRIGVPVFVLPPVDAKPVLAWRAVRTREGPLKLLASNQGTAHVQIAQYALQLGRNRDRRAQQVAAYVLSGEDRYWMIDDSPLPGTAVHLSAQTDSGDVDLDLLVESE